MTQKPDNWQLVVLIKLDGIAEIEAHIGAYIFAASVLLTMILSEWLGRQLKNQNMDKSI